MDLQEPITWEEPPPDADSGARWRAIADALRSRANEWALVDHSAYVHIKYGISKAKIAAFRPSGHFEVRAQKVPGTDRYKVWARYVGDKAVAR